MSFGRDKAIAQNRINQRYPDSMPTLRKMRDDIIARAVKLGIDIVAAAPLQPVSDAGQLALKDAPGVRTVFAFAFQTPPELKNGKDLPQKCDEAYGYPAYLKMHQILLRLARMIEDYGYSAASYTDYPAFAAMTDLGKIENGEFITPEFGRNQFIGAIATSAPVDSTNRISGKLEIDRPARLEGKALRLKLEVMAENSLVSMFGAAPAERLNPVADQLKKVIDEKQLGKRIIDANRKLTYHGKYIPEIIDENLKIRKPSDYVEGAKSVIVLGMHYPDELIRNSGLEKSQQIGCYNFHQYQTRWELCFAALELASYLDKMGYKSMITENLLGVGSYTDSPRGPLPDMRCSALEAVAAGMGEIGTSGALLTPAHGPHQRRICIVTDAELTYEQPSKAAGSCKKCTVCAEKCPMDAISGKSVKLDVGGVSVDYALIPRHRCDWAKRYSLHPDEGPALIGNNTRADIPKGEISIEQLAEACKAKDPIMKSRTCILEPCLRHCPAGMISTK
jgi:ferredoxin